MAAKVKLLGSSTSSTPLTLTLGVVLTASILANTAEVIDVPAETTHMLSVAATLATASLNMLSPRIPRK